MRQVFRQMPGHDTVFADDTIGGAGVDEVDAAHATASPPQRSSFQNTQVSAPSGIPACRSPLRRAPRQSPSYRYRRFDRRMVLVIYKLEVVELVVEDRRGLAFDLQRRVGEGRTRQLQRHLFGMVAVNVAVAAGPDEVADVEVALLRHHVGQQGITRDVERHAEKNVGAALVELATEFAFAAGL